jgi:hypothetical protein
MNRLTKQWCDEVRGSKDEESSIHKYSLSSDREELNNENKKKKKRVQRVHFNKIKHLNNNKNHHQEETNIVFESESSFEEEEDILHKNNTKT